MPSLDVPFFGKLVLCLVLVSTAYTAAMGVRAARGHTHLLAATRAGMLATCGFVASAVLVLAYAFQTHDFRITYVARYSDRSMPWEYLLASLWGGQDGSILWWTFLLSCYTTAATLWIRNKLPELQPYFFVTLASIFAFFVILMLFAANPFATYAGAAPPDGEGLNPLLQNYWMTIHPPSLYMGFVGWSIPFAICIAALASGKLDETWIHAARPWAMIAWMFLSLGLLLGCAWSYEELGWGGYWAWDPVENASFMPWLVGTAYVHSALVQERYGMLKVWNVVLMCGTFFMTIFGTFLTRSGIIASVHSFARSDIGWWFLGYMIVLVVVIAGLIAWRYRVLTKVPHQIDALLSREFMFLLNNWILIGMMVFVLGATMWPKITDLLYGEEATVGPPFYNRWMPAFGLALLFLAGFGPLVSWRKATSSNLMRAMVVPLAVGLVALALHIIFGQSVGFPAYVHSDALYDDTLGVVLSKLNSVAPAISSFVCAFTLASIAQEFARGTGVRMRTKNEGVFTALGRLTWRARRRYGGYIVHAGVAVMFVGFTGAAWDETQEAALAPNGTLSVRGYDLAYQSPRMTLDPDKRMIFTDLDVTRDGDALGRVSPAKFLYRRYPDSPTTEVAIMMGPREDVYVIMSSVDPTTRRGIFRVIVRPLVIWIWLGGLFGLLGALLSIWPDFRPLVRAQAATASRTMPRAVAVATTLMLAIGLPFVPTLASAQESSSLHAGHVELESEAEGALFSRLLCQCGGCPRLPLDSCICSWAEQARTDLRARLEAGESPATIQASYRAQHGGAAIAVPDNEGHGKLIWAVPLALAAGAVIVIVGLGRKWRAASSTTAVATAGTLATDTSDDFDAKLDEELRRGEDEASS